MNGTLAVVLFAVTYAGIALGHVPGLALDRTGFALLGAIAMVAAGVLPLDAAMQSIHLPTLLLLYGLMIVSAQLRLSGFYTAVADRLGRLASRPRTFLGLLMAAAAVLSAILVNDIICLALAPLVIVVVLRSRLNPVPYLLGLGMASNIGSAATLIGNPQNMLIGQVGRLDFRQFTLWCAPPTLASLVAAYGLLLLLYRGRLAAAGEAPAVVAVPEPAPPEPAPPFNAHQARKGVAAVLIVMAMFFTQVPRELTALTVAGLLLCSRRMHTRALLGLVDWHLITLFCGLFIVVQAFQNTGLPAHGLEWLRGRGIDPAGPVALVGVGAALSNLVSNVPAVALIVRFLDPDQPTSWYALALASTLAGNLITLGSIANLIVIEQAARHGIRIRFREFARAGVPVTLASLALVLLWVWLRA